MANYNESYKDDFAESMAMYLEDEKFQSILNFYLWECPVKGTSAKGRDFETYGIIKNTDYKKLKGNMLKSTNPPLRKDYSFKACNKGEVDSEVKNTEKEILPPDEFCVFYKRKASVGALFTSIRNAFAHGSFYIKQYSGFTTYVLKDRDNGGFITGQMALHEETLLNWTDCVREFNKSEQE